MNTMNRIPKRSEIAVEDTWALEDLFASDELWEQELDAVTEEGKKLSAYAGRLEEGGKTLYEYLELMEQVWERASLLGNYCNRKLDEDTTVAKYQAMTGKFQSVMVAISAETSFDTPEIMAISDEKLSQMYADEPKLERYRRYLTNARRRREHFLSPAEEKLLAAAQEMADAPSSIYSAFENADLKFPDAVDADGKKYPLSQGTFVMLEESPDRELRKSAYENLYRTLSGFQNTAAGLLNAQGKQLKF